MLILVAGSKSQIGEDLFKYFKKKTDIIGLERNKITINKLKDKKSKIIRTKDPFKYLIKKKINFDLYINCIVVHEYSKKKNKKFFFQSNVLILRKLVKIFNLQKKNSLFVNFSTRKVSELNFINSKKQSKIINMYAQTKKLGELEAQKCNKNYVNLRLPGVITKKINPNRPWFSKIIKSVKSNRVIKIYNYNKNFNNFIDTYEIFLILLKLKKIKKIKGTFEISSSIPEKLGNIINMIIKHFNSSSKILVKGNTKTHKIINNKIFTNKTGIKISKTRTILKRILKNYD